jgi:DNA adenine methylase
MNKTKITPVRYPGGKSNALKFLNGHFPTKFDEYHEPFFGGGSVGLYLMQTHKDADYWINDLFYPVYCFWKVLYEQPEAMVDCISYNKNQFLIDKIQPKQKGIPSKNAENGKNLHSFCRRKIQSTIHEKDVFHTACYWYILNKTSYSGMSMIGSYAPLAWDQNFSDNCIKNLPETSKLMHSVKSLKITNLDYSELLNPVSKDVFIFLDPPYKIPHNLYGEQGNMHKGFDHNIFVENTLKCPHKWMVTYNEDSDLITRFGHHKQIKWELQYTMASTKRVDQEGSKNTGKSGKKGKELLIMNY